LMVADPGGRPRRIGVPTESIGAFATSDRRVIWTANGCLLSANLTDAPATAPDPGPCPRTEAGVADSSSRIGHDRRLPLRVRCFAAPKACRGYVEVSLDPGRRASTTVSFSIPAGARRTLAPRITRRAYRRVARRGRAGALFGVLIVTFDPDGRRNRRDDSVNAAVR
jgi:hypothetical protein